MRKTIGRNQRKRAKQIFANAQNIRAYTLDNGFVGESCNREDYKGENWLLRNWITFDFARLTEDVPNEYCLHIHSNCWYKFTN